MKERARLQEGHKQLHAQLHRKLRKVNRQLQWPAIYSSRELLREVKRERQQILTKLRDLPLAG